MNIDDNLVKKLDYDTPYIDLSNNYLTDNSLKYLNSTNLNLAENSDITSRGIKQLKNVEKLNIMFCYNIYILDCISYLPNLKELCIAHVEENNTDTPFYKVHNQTISNVLIRNWIVDFVGIDNCSIISAAEMKFFVKLRSN